MAVDVLSPVVPEAKWNPSFRELVQSPVYSPARWMLSEVAKTLEDRDGNFVKDFQTTGFDARMWELYLHAAFLELSLLQPHSEYAPDFRLCNSGKQAFVEAVVSRPSSDRHIAELLDEPPGDDDPLALQAYYQHAVALKLANPIYSKVQYEYWDMPHVQGCPFGIAVAPFFSKSAQRMGSYALVGYLFGMRFEMARAADGSIEVVDEPVDEIVYKGRRKPAGLFRTDPAKNLSYVLFSNSGTLAKFQRMGVLLGPPFKEVLVRRKGWMYDRSDRWKLKEFNYPVGFNEPKERWSHGLEVIHNPWASKRVNMDYFKGCTQHRLGGDRQFSSQIEGLPISSSVTYSHHMAGVEDLHGLME